MEEEEDCAIVSSATPLTTTPLTTTTTTPLTTGASSKKARSKKRPRRCEGEDVLEESSEVEDVLWDLWVSEVVRLEGCEFHQSEVVRGESWRCNYVHVSGKLFLSLSLLEQGGAEWSCSLEPPTSRGELRDRLQRPQLRARVAADARSFLAGLEWHVRLPLDDHVHTTLTLCGEQIDAYESTFGIEDEGVQGLRRFAQLRVAAGLGVGKLDADVSGTYEALPQCSAALGSLHARTAGGDGQPMYFFLESRPVGAAEDDVYVFARDWRKLHLSEHRASLVCSLPHKWRPCQTKGDSQVVPKAQELQAHVQGRWAPLASLSLRGHSRESGLDRGTVAYVTADHALNSPLDLRASDPRRATAARARRLGKRRESSNVGSGGERFFKPFVYVWVFEEWGGDRVCV